jgi:hypothetical protein
LAGPPWISCVMVIGFSRTWCAPGPLALRRASGRGERAAKAVAGSVPSDAYCCVANRHRRRQGCSVLMKGGV